jgi:hypothetical protein
MKDKPQLSAELIKRLNKIIKNDLGRQGVAIVTWGEEDYEPRTQLEAELRNFLATALEEQKQRYVRKVEKLFDYKTGKPVPRADYQCVCGYEWDDCSCDHNSAIDDVLAILNGKE